MTAVLNNDAERDLRTYVIWRKTSFGTQGARGNDFLENVLSVIATCKRQGRNAFRFMTDAVQRYFQGDPAPSLLPA